MQDKPQRLKVEKNAWSLKHEIEGKEGRGETGWDVRNGAGW